MTDETGKIPEASDKAEAKDAPRPVGSFLLRDTTSNAGSFLLRDTTSGAVFVVHQRSLVSHDLTGKDVLSTPATTLDPQETTGKDVIVTPEATREHARVMPRTRRLRNVTCDVTIVDPEPYDLKQPPTFDPRVPYPLAVLQTSASGVPFWRYYELGNTLWHEVFMKVNRRTRYDCGNTSRHWPWLLANLHTMCCTWMDATEATDAEKADSILDHLRALEAWGGRAWTAAQGKLTDETPKKNADEADVKELGPFLEAYGVLKATFLRLLERAWNGYQANEDGDAAAAATKDAKAVVVVKPWPVVQALMKVIQTAPSDEVAVDWMTRHRQVYTDPSNRTDYNFKSLGVVGELVRADEKSFA